jgi:hypothetical protein
MEPNLKKERLAAPMPCASDPANLTGAGLRFEVSCKKRHVFREIQVLLSKVSYEECGLDSNEVLCLQELFLRATFYAEQDFNYIIWLVRLEAVADLVMKLEPKQCRARELKVEFWKIGISGRDMILSPHEYFGLKSEKYREGHVRYRWTYPRKVKPPLERYVGVGYKDKGNCRNLSWDGSPTLKEFCSTDEFRAIIEREPRRSNYGDKLVGHPTANSRNWTYQMVRQRSKGVLSNVGSRPSNEWDLALF